MNQFFDAIKVDLLDRRRRPLLILALVALVGAVAYAAIASNSSSSSSQSSGAPEPVLGASGVHVTQGQSTNQAVAETTSGATQQHRGSSRDPFTPLPGSVQPTKSSSTTSSTTSATTTTGNSASGSGKSGGGTSAPAPTPRVKVKTVYRVAVLFGKAAPGTPAVEANLTPYENLKLNQLIPSTKAPIVAFRGVLASRKGAAEGQAAAFTLVGEAIPRGLGVCKPSAVQCQTLDLKVGQTEELEVLEPNGETTNYELQVASIVFVTTAKTASAFNHSYGGGLSPSGSALLEKLGLLAIPGLSYSPSTNLLVASRAHHASRAHAAVRRAG